MDQRVLVADDDARVRQTFSRNLTLDGYSVLTAADGEEALQVFREELPDIALVDVRMPRLDGFQVLRAIREQDSEAEVILVTGHGDMDTAIEALRAGASDFISKPVEQRTLEAALRRAQDRLRMKRQLRAAQQALQEHAAELEERNADLDAFAHTVAHSLKGSLHIIVGQAELLMAADTYGLSEQKQHESRHTIARRSRQMNHTIDELMLLANIRKIDLTLAPLDMGSVVDAAQQRLSSLIEARGAEIIYPEEWPSALGYGPWVEEVWVNYLTNALKYGGTPPRIELGVSPQGDSIRFWIKDNGRGIKAQDQARLYTPFTRIDQAAAQGHGLGLSIVKRIVEKLGGTVGVESESGAGSVFWFTLPAEEAQDVPDDTHR
ncbi:MAG: hybrid sensor histidine kinase/response regulator [Anaerolineae bacterium]|jgi:signal transduction histidine kinase